MSKGILEKKAEAEIEKLFRQMRIKPNYRRLLKLLVAVWSLGYYSGTQDAFKEASGDLKKAFKPKKKAAKR